MRKTTALLLALVLIGGLAAACTSDPSTSDGENPGNPGPSGGGNGNNGGTPNGNPGEHFEISIAHWEINSSFPDGAEDAVRDYIQEKFNVTIVPAGLSWADNVPEMTSMWAATGQLPDVTSAEICWTAQFRQWVEDDVIRSIPQSLYSKYPNINAIVAGDAAIQALMMDGELWFIPRPSSGDPKDWFIERGIINRKDWRIALGFDVPQTKQDFIDLCAAYATMDPKGDGSYTVGLSFDMPGFPFSQSFPTFGVTDFEWLPDANGNWYVPAYEAFELGSFLRDIGRAGGLDPDFITYQANTDNSGTWKFANSQLGMLVVQPNINVIWRNIGAQFLALNPGTNLLDHIEILQPPIDGGSDPAAFITAAYWSENYIRADVSDEKLDRILAMYDWLMSIEGQLMMNFGIEGTDWQWDAAGDVELLTPINPNTGEREPASTIYPILSGGFQYLGCWNADVEWFSPVVPKDLREYLLAELDFRKTNWTAKPTNYALALEVVPEKDAIGHPWDFGMGFWAPFILDRSSASNEELYESMRANMDAAGYAAAKEAMTARAREMGIN